MRGGSEVCANLPAMTWSRPEHLPSPPGPPQGKELQREACDVHGLTAVNRVGIWTGIPLCLPQDGEYSQMFPRTLSYRDPNPIFQYTVLKLPTSNDAWVNILPRSLHFFSVSALEGLWEIRFPKAARLQLAPLLSVCSRLSQSGFG